MTAYSVDVSDTVVVGGDALLSETPTEVNAVEEVLFIESLQIQQALALELSELVPLVDSVSTASITPIDGYSFQVNFLDELDTSGITDPANYELTPLNGVPVTIESVESLHTELATGANGSVDSSLPNGVTSRFVIPTGTFTVADIGRYLEIDLDGVPALLRIEDVPAPTVLVLDGMFVPNTTPALIAWRFLSGVTGVIIVTTKTTRGASYSIRTHNIKTRDGQEVLFEGAFTSVAALPQLSPTLTLLDDGLVIADFGEPMQSGPVLSSPAEYSITGPSPVSVIKVIQLDSQRVGLYTLGLESGSYTLTVNASGTPKDIAGNPIDPTFNSAIFTGSSPLTPRSIFTDKGPITKPAQTLQSGVSAVIDNFTDVTLPGAALTSNHVGLYLTLSGGVINGGTFRILAVLSATEATLQASFSLPDPNSGSLTWALVDPRNGQIADDPADVVVRINSIPVTPDAVIGLLGQIVLGTTPTPTDDVQVDYSWICNPTVDIRRLNSREFRLNSWNRDVGYPLDTSQHKYRYNNTLIQPGLYVPDDMQSVLDQPLLRELHYRAYERAYTAVLNDPNLLVLNTPIHKIAYPPMQRQLSESFIRYEALTLPENDTIAPWVKKGVGVVSVSLGVLTVEDNSSGVFPTGQNIFWTKGVDLSFPHVFAMAWRCEITSVSTFDGVFSGIAAGYSDELTATILGCIEDAGVKKIGFLRRGSTDDPSLVPSWVGSFDSFGNPTYQPVDFDWSILHTYRLYRDPSGVVKLYVDGDVTETLKIAPDDRPFLEELNAPFDEIQGTFFGSVSRPAKNISKWDFVRYLSIPLNPQQIAPSTFVSYEANVNPEEDAKPWTPVGFHGTETILSTDFLLLDSTSATDVPVSTVGLVGADFRGFVRVEPLLTAASEVVLDIDVELRTHTFGVTPNGLMAAIDNGDRLIQLCLFPDRSTPKKSYGGRSFPGDFSPYFWSSMGTATAEMAGRILRITDASVGDGKVYFVDDVAPPFVTDPARVVLAGIDYILEFRAKVVSYTSDLAGFSGVFAQVFDGTRAVGAMLVELLGVKYVALTSDGADLGPLTWFAFNWGDGEPHTYRLVKNTTGDLVSLFVDGIFVGAFAYSSFVAPPPVSTGQISFGSSTPASAAALSVVEWSYCNVWRVLSDQRHFVGLWKGFDQDSLTGYHLPLKASGRDALVTGNALGDPEASFIADGIVAGDQLIVDAGSNKGVYEVAAVSTPTSLTIVGSWPAGPSQVNYRIAKETDWTTQHKYRILKNPTGDVVVLIDADPVPLIEIDYNSLDLPLSSVGVVRTLTGGLAGIAFGSFEPTDLSQSHWDFVRYGITRSLNELRIVPHHEFLNQWNVMASPEHLRTSLPHSHTSFKSSSTGIPPKIDPDFLTDLSLIAYTLLNEGTPLVPQTQTFELRGPYPVQEFVSALNRPEDVLNNDGDFTLNDGAKRFKLVVPDDVLYTSLDVIEQETGTTNLITPFCDGCGLLSMALEYTKEVCLTYTGDVLPESDTSAPTPWVLLSDDPGQVSATVFGGILTYGTGVIGTRTVYRNDTPLPDAPGLQTEVTFRLKLLNDSTGGTGDSQVRFGLSAPGMTLGLAFVTTSLAERYVLAVDLNSGITLGAVSFDYLDGLYHTYRIVRNPGANQVQIFIDA